ncbi:hypothetical protein chiPu_0016729 [Chiloscyllium punctatum]|uniref:Nudix hydrolase domain-containing protein n=1 Tax=Chiloscyllium punctatum TaxID=137246 RepID=A0A401T6H4_CHIPU|nr:hypothetical protein [Chiloscyllium punctatum]
MEPNNTANQSIVKEEVLAKGKWAQLLQTTYIDPTGKTRVWETVKRTTRKPSSKSDGLIDDGETAEVAALRELLEETGYIGEISETTPDLCLDPGLTNCTMQYVSVNINGDDSENLHPKQRLDDGEFVEVILIPMNELRKKLDEMLQKENIVVDARVYAFAMGLMYASSKPNMLPVLKA